MTDEEENELQKLQGRSYSPADTQCLAETAIRAVRQEDVASVVRLLVGATATDVAAAILENCGRIEEKEKLFPGRTPSAEDRTEADRFLKYARDHREAPGRTFAPGLEGEYLSQVDTSTIAGLAADLAADRRDADRVKALVSKLTGAKALDVATRVLLTFAWEESKLPKPLAGRLVEEAEDSDATARSFVTWARRPMSV